MSRAAKLYNRWSLELRRSRLFLPGERVGVAVSGGADSVLLLHFMKQFSTEAGLSLAVLHFNHRLRGAESNADERFVVGCAQALCLEFIRGDADVGQLARTKRRNVEAMARELRYRFFFTQIRRGLLNKVVTAHTANDQAETVLLRLLRGSGARGLGGIFASLEGKILRPFLEVTRAEVLAELESRGLEFRVDSSNRDLRYARNRIRHQLLPLLIEKYNPATVELLKNLAARARDDETFLEQAAAHRARPWRIREDNEERIPIRPLLELPPALARRVLRQMAVAAANGPAALTHEHIEAVRRFASSGQSGKSMALPGGLSAVKEFEWLVVASRSPVAESESYFYPIEPPAEVSIAPLNLKLKFTIIENVHNAEMKWEYNKLAVCCLDHAKLDGGLTLRNWLPGDFFQPAQAATPVKLKELFLTRRIPMRRRRSWPVLLSGKEIVWIYGFPAAQHVVASHDSARVLKIEERRLRGSEIFAAL
jgi:tRNA(Ile)-lysidine synthase